MLTLGNLIIYFFEGLAVSAALYLLARRQLRMAEMVIMALSISVTFMILDLFAPGIATGARQGTGFGLGFRQVAGGTHPRYYYGDQNQVAGGTYPRYYYGDQNQVIEGMDDPAAIQYYQRYNPSDSNQSLQEQRQHYLSNNPQFQLQSQADPQFQLQSQGDPQFQSQSQVDPQIPSPIFNKLHTNPFETTIRSSTGSESPSAIFDAENIPHTIGEAETAPLLYSPVKPTNGYRYQFPRGWDEVEQANLYKTFNTSDSQPTGYDKNNIDNYQYQKKNI